MIIMKVNHSLFLKLILGVGIILLLSMSIMTFLNIRYHEKKVMANVMAEADRFSKTIKLGTHYAMMTNKRGDIAEIIRNIAKQKDVRYIRIYYKFGQIKFSNVASEINTVISKKEAACEICHKTTPPVATLSLQERTRIYYSPKGRHLLGIVSPIYNEPSCYTASCHVHPAGETILGTLDVVLSLDRADKEILFLKKAYLAGFLVTFLATSGLIYLFLFRFVNQPVQKLVEGTRLIARGEPFHPVIKRHDDIGELAAAISSMGDELAAQQADLMLSYKELVKASKKLEKLSTTDALTGLHNRLHLQQISAVEFERVQRYGHDLSVLMIDVDHFKKVNDGYGHLFGDMVLKEIARRLKKTVRNTDIIARYGGEEIVVLLLETNAAVACTIAEKLRAAIELREFSYKEQSLRVTISIGIATYHEANFSGWKYLLAAADQALYHAKNMGRNRVAHADREACGQWPA